MVLHLFEHIIPPHLELIGLLSIRLLFTNVVKVEEWSKAGQVAKLEMVVMQGRGDLISSITKMWNEEVRNFTKKVPALMVLGPVDNSQN